MKKIYRNSQLQEAKNFIEFIIYINNTEYTPLWG